MVYWKELYLRHFLHKWSKSNSICLEEAEFTEQDELEPMASEEWSPI